MNCFPSEVDRAGGRRIVVAGVLRSIELVVHRVRSGWAGNCDGAHVGLVPNGHEGVGVVGEPLGVIDDAVEHRLHVEAGGADRFQDIGHCGLAFEGGVEVVEQIRVAMASDACSAKDASAFSSATSNGRTSWRYMCSPPTGAPSRVKIARA